MAAVPSVSPLSPVSVQRQQSTALCVDQPLSDSVSLRLVQIPAGEFLMGSPDTELERRGNEGPQHLVRVPGFWIGQYPITQEQWRVVAGLDQVGRDLRPNPSQFEGDTLPVENVSWDEAVEFCARLSAKTDFIYRLPSEAEWEYACRAGTSTPFHFGETITTDLSNYRGVDREIGGRTYPGAYGDGPLGEYRERTTPVGSLEVANAFGLYDMHGNVWEWCQDHWHDDYRGAPLDGSAWQEDSLHNNGRVRRGGAWFSDPRNCRSAYRSHFTLVNRVSNLGFRVVLAPR